MKIKSKIYAQALAELMIGGKDLEKISEKFLKLLDKNGDMRRAKEIVALAEEIFAKKLGKKKIVVETARKILPQQEELVGSVAKPGDAIYKKINPELIAGIKIIVNDEQLDMSVQNKLRNIFK